MEYDSRTPVIATYQMYPFYRTQIIATFSIMAVVPPLMILLDGGGSAAPPLALVWLGMVGWSGYLWLFRVCYRLDLVGDELRWWAPMRSGSVRVDQIREIRPSRYGRRVATVQVGDGTSILVMTSRGFAAFTQRLQAAAPLVPVRLSWYMRLFDSSSRRSAR